MCDLLFNNISRFVEIGSCIYLIVRQSIHDTARNGARFLMWHLCVQVAHFKPLQHATMCVYKLWMDAKEDLEVENIVEGA